MQVRLERLSTGLRINRGADDPAGLIISERLRSEIGGIRAAIDNAERASNVIATAEAALAEVARLLNDIKGLTVQSANTSGLSAEEIEANQLQVNSAVDSITRIANTTSFAGLKLLNGSLDYITSGVATSAITDVKIFSANFGANATVPVSVEVMASAQKAGLYMSTGTLALPSALTLEVAGNNGVEVIQFGSGTTLTQMVTAINRTSDSTGVTASIVSGESAGLSALRFQSTDFGSDAFVSVERTDMNTGAFFDTYQTIGNPGSNVTRDTGEDVLAMINGNLALGDGTKVKLNTSGLKLEMQLDATYAQTTGAGSQRDFTVTGGGAVFQLGSRVESQQQVSLGLQSIAANELGNNTIGFINSIVSGGDNSLVQGKTQEASLIVDEAITQVSVLRGRMGSFELNTLQTNVRSLQTSLENLTASESRIRDTDFADEVSKLTRAQVLTQVGTSILATANNTSQNVLALLQ
jgi:flagellin